MARIVIIDDEEHCLTLLAQVCRRMGHEAFPAATGREGLEMVERVKPELLIVDLRVGDASGLEIIRECRKSHPRARVIMVTGYGSVETAVEAMKLGAFDYLLKPFDLEDLRRGVQLALQPEATSPAAEAVFLPESPDAPLIGESAAMRRILNLARRVADRHGPVLLEGEYGVGKQTVARAIHNAGRRAAAPFKVLNCGSLPEDLLEAELFGARAGAERAAATVFRRAAGGTAVLEEINALPLRLQSLLDAFLEEHARRRAAGALSPEEDFRFVATADRPLEELVERREFRADLYYRVSVIPVTIPPLRERREDIAPLAERFLENVSRASGEKRKTLDRDALRLLQLYPWPGNTGELQNAIERACSFAEEEVIRPEDLPPRVLRHQGSVPPSGPDPAASSLPVGITLEEFIRGQERLFIRETLKHHDGSRRKAAETLGVSMATLYRKLQ